MRLQLPALALGALVSFVAEAYPVDGYPATGIRRLDHAVRVQSGELPGARLPPGALLPLDAVVPAYAGGTAPPLDLTPDRGLSARIREMLAEEATDYAVALLDLSDPKRPAYAELNGHIRRNIGSVGKILVGLAWFQALAAVYPDDVDARARVMRESIVTGDDFVPKDHHTVTFFEPASARVERRRIAVGDRGNLWEWLDWMLSASNNSAAAMVQKQVMVLRRFGREYPPAPAAEAAYFAENSRGALGQHFIASIAIVSGPAPGQDLHYLVAVSSNVLRKNSAVAHQTLAGRIHRMIEARHRAASGPGG